MSKKKVAVQRGFTLAELMIATPVMAIVILSIGVLIVDGQRGWTTMYDFVYGDVTTDGYVASAKFDAVMRMASREKFLLDDAGSWLEVYYYAGAGSAVLDRYARFTFDSFHNELKFEYGSLNPRAQLSTETMCSNVSSCVFKAGGRSVQMILTLDDGLRTATVVSSAAMHNR